MTLLRGKTHDRLKVKKTSAGKAQKPKVTRCVRLIVLVCFENKSLFPHFSFKNFEQRLRMMTAFYDFFKAGAPPGQNSTDVIVGLPKNKDKGFLPLMVMRPAQNI